MEAEPVELEEGEIVDDEAGDVFETYNVLQRPHMVGTTNEPSKMGYSDESDDSADSESDSDSDSAHRRIKKPKLKLKRAKSTSKKGWTEKNDKYKVWCTQVQEESLTEDLVSCGVTKNMFQERSVESYDFTLRYLLNGNQHQNNNSSDDERDIEYKYVNKRTNADRQNLKLRLGRRKHSMEVDNHKGSMRIMADLETTSDSTNEDVATDITNKLNEKKDTLIRKIVDIVGKEKAIDFYQATKRIEEEGGLLIMNGSRRRTAGGVYLYLVKHDEHIPQEKIREIFAYDKKDMMEQKKKAEAQERRLTAQKFMRSLEKDSDKDLPALLTRAELSTRQIAEEAKLRRGEGMDRISLDSERTVTNPPPSPVTDDPDHSEHLPLQRQVQDYSDDFLDIGVDVDSMEVF